MGRARAAFNAALHPRGPDGRFIGKGSLGSKVIGASERGDRSVPSSKDTAAARFAAARRALPRTTMVASSPAGTISRSDAAKGTTKQLLREGSTAPKATASTRLARPAGTWPNSRTLRGFTDDELANVFAAITNHPVLDAPALTRVAGEMDRRDTHRRTIDQQAAARDKRLDELVAAGWSFRDAYAEAHGLTSDELDRQERRAIIDTSRRKGETREQTLRRLYAEQVCLQWLAAEEVTRGHMLTPEAQRAGVKAVTLFSGPAARARKWASEDLKRWWADHPRVTYTEFRATMLGGARDRAAAQRSRLQGNGRDFGL